MPRVYSYIRFSDSRQAAGASTERQIEFARRWAADHGLTLDDSLTLRDEGLSAYHQRHVSKGALGAFLAAIEGGRIEPGSVLLVESLDRLSRAEALTALAQLTQIIDGGVAVVTACDGKQYTREALRAQPMDLLHSILVMIRAHEESATKSRRVRDAIRRQCDGWVAGTYRGLIRYGKTPGWMRVAGGRGELIPERAEALRLAVQMWRAGSGLGRIAQALHAAGLRTSDAEPSSGHLSRLLTHPALVGDKVLTLDGQSWTLTDYYPAVVNREVYTELLGLASARGRRTVRGTVPPVLTGTGITHCGYCGAPLKSQTMQHRMRPDGTLADGARRLQCSSNNTGQRCPVPGSCSAAPIERAIAEYCGDWLRMRALYSSDLAALPRARLAQAQTRLDEADRQMARLVDAMLAAGDTPPAAFVGRARQMEAERATLADAVARAQQDLDAASRANLSDADARWRQITAGMQSLDYDARMTARQLVLDTFARIDVYHHGIRPRTSPPGTIDLVLISRDGVGRMLTIDARGGWVDGEVVRPPTS